MQQFGTPAEPAYLPILARSAEAKRQFLFRGPGHFEGFTEPGERVLRAIKPGFANTELKKTLLPGKHVKVELKLYTPEQLIEHKRRWPVWIPYVVTAGGALIAGSSAVLLVQSNHKLQGFDDQASHDPACSNGCPPSLGLTELHDTGNTYRTVATVGLATGGAIFALGSALMILNLPKELRITPEERERRDGTTRSFAVVPLVGPRYAALVGTASF